jgi:CubicO group peptidase (beta-lactamase class C family)
MIVEKESYLRSLINGLAEEYCVPGAQLVIWEDGRSLSVETGYERYATDSPVARESSFLFGSITKSFVATAIMELASGGSVELDESIGKYIPEVAVASNDIGHVVTVRQLLTHTSGLPTSFEGTGLEAVSLRQYARACGELELVCQPGSAFSYSNVGCSLVGRILEEVTGGDWWEAVEFLLLLPLGIKPVFAMAREVHGGRRPSVSGHAVDVTGCRVTSVNPLCPAYLGPAGGLCGSAADLVRFARMHLGTDADAPELLGQPELTGMRQAVVGAEPFGIADAWGLGLAIFATESGNWFGHDGALEGMTCHLRFHPESGTALAVATNAGSGMRMWEGMIRGLHEIGLDVGGLNFSAIPERYSQVPDPPNCVGVYANGETRYEIFPDDRGSLRLDMGTGTAVEMNFYDSLLFSAKDAIEGGLPIPGKFVCAPGSDEIEGMVRSGQRAMRLEGPRGHAGINGHSGGPGTISQWSNDV